MATANIGNRMHRQGRTNPGRKHLAGADMNAKMQRQYEHILQSYRDSHRFRSDRKRKEIAAATVRKMAQNPSILENWRRNLFFDDQGRAEALAEDFHGRPVEDVIDVEETEEYDEHGSVLGYLIELFILDEDDNDYGIPIVFPYDPQSENNILVTSNPAGTNIEFIGGNQEITNLGSIPGANFDDKYLVLVGAVCEISYWTDKHHLAGPKDQKTGMEYYHEFGEKSGDLPYLVYDRRNTKLLFVGGEYTVEPEGITG